MNFTVFLTYFIPVYTIISRLAMPVFSVLFVFKSICSLLSPPEGHGGLYSFLRAILDRKPPSWNRLLFYMFMFQFLSALQAIFRADTENIPQLSVIFVMYFSFELICFLFSRYILKHENLAHELIGFYLTGIGLCVVISSEPNRAAMQLAIITVGVILYYISFSLLRKPLLMLRLRPVFIILGLVLFAINLVFGASRFGSKNWLELFGFSIQPSEFVKVFLILSGGEALEKLSGKKNMLVFSCFSALCILCLFLMNDFGTAAIFFVTFLIIFFMRTGNWKLLLAICLAAVIALVSIIAAKPHIASRFSAWLHVWDYPSSLGYQQTRTLIAAASGGLLGVGIGAGYLKNIAAATTDLVFGILCEEWGLITSVISVCAIAGLGLASCLGIEKRSRGAYCAITGCAAAALLIFQTCLNIFGATDILPLTGVTLPFISRGGSSMLSCWILLAVCKVSQNWETDSVPKKEELI